MKRILLSILSLSTGFIFAQFKVNIEAQDSFAKNRVIVYTQSGSKDFIAAEATKKNGKWVAQIPTQYKGMLRAYFPENGQSVSFISENKNVEIKLDTDNEKIKKVNYLDEANFYFREASLLQQKKESILPALSQIKNFYNDGSTFDNALQNEILRIEKTNFSVQENSFLEFYLEGLKYAGRDARNVSSEEYKNFILNSDEMLESSSLMRPVLMNLLRSIPRENLISEIDSLLNELNIETNRGQVVLSELLSIFEMYGLTEEKEKYYQKASSLTCSINKNLKESINTIKNTSVGAVFEDYAFTPRVKNTKAKRISEIKADKKVILFWSSTCPHCLSELPIILENYELLKQKNIQVIAISLDSDKASYETHTSALPWINDAELKGWRSSVTEKYNIQGTPTYYVLDNKNKIIDKPVNFSAFLKTINVK